jgi:hypothetical protein
MHAHDNVKGTCGEFQDSFRDKLSNNSVVVVMEVVAKVEPAKDSEELALSPQQ